MFCPDCGAENKEGSRFCKNCGASLNKSKSDGTLKSKVANSQLQEDSSINSNVPQNSSGANGNKNTLIICVTAIICVAIIACAFLLFNSNQADDSETVILNDSEDDINSSDDDSAKTTTATSSSSNEMTFDEAKYYLSGASNTVISNSFDEADANGDGVLTGSEIDKFKYLADVTDRTADTSNTEHVEASDQGAGDGTTKTRYCTTHGRVAVGSDNLCPYCLEEGLDARTLKGSTEYI